MYHVRKSVRNKNDRMYLVQKVNINMIGNMKKCMMKVKHLILYDIEGDCPFEKIVPFEKVSLKLENIEHI